MVLCVLTSPNKRHWGCCTPRQLEQSLRLEAGERDAAESRSLAQHNIELRRLLDEEQAAYKRKLQAYQEGQQRQAQLVQKLQAKVGPRRGNGGVLGWGDEHQRVVVPFAVPSTQVLQYKKKCGEVEQQLLEKATELEQERLTVSSRMGVSRCPPLFPTSTSKGLMSPQSQLDISGSQLEEESSNELENALIRLEEEQQRCRRGSPGCRVLRDPPGITPWPCAPSPQEQQPGAGELDAAGAAGTSQRGQRGAERGHPQADGRLDAGAG